MKLLKNRKLMITSFFSFLLITNSLLIASQDVAVLIIKNNTKEYNIQAKDIKFYYIDHTYDMETTILPPGQKQSFAQRSAWLSWTSSRLTEDKWFSTLKLTVWKTGTEPSSGETKEIKLTSDGNGVIFGVPIKISSKGCYDSRTYAWGTTYHYCDYEITVGDE